MGGRLSGIVNPAGFSGLNPCLRAMIRKWARYYGGRDGGHISEVSLALEHQYLLFSVEIQASSLDVERIEFRFRRRGARIKL